jgi:hypothetical protein
MNALMVHDALACCTRFEKARALYSSFGCMCSGVLNDFYALNPANMTWINLSSSVSGSLPGPRCNFGFASAGGKLFVFGGEATEGYFEFYCSCLETGPT